MKITKQRLKEIIQEELNAILEGDRRVPPGFTDATRMPGAASELEPYRRWTQNRQFRAGTWNMNNGTILVVDRDGRPHVWIPKSDPGAPRQVSAQEAMTAVEAAGFVEDRNLPVPYSNF